MATDASAYAALGIDPGADDAEIERAYKKLIKQHHPDREGGDSARAAEINQAYRDLRAVRHLKAPLELSDEWISKPTARRAWLAFALLLVGASLFLLVAQGPLAPLTEGFASPSSEKIAPARSKPAARKDDVMDQPLHADAIDGAVREARRLARGSDEMELATVSRNCHHALRTDPSLTRLDRCAAFDDAVVQLQDRDPLRDQGPFSELAVTGRIWGGASALSEDSVAIDGRLDRIRLRVELALASTQAAPPAR